MERLPRDVQRVCISARNASRLDLASNESVATSGTLVKSNKSAIAGLYYSVTESLNLVGEYIKTTAKNQAGGENKDSVIALGAILFF